MAQIAEAVATKINYEYEYFQANPIRPRLCAAAGLMHDMGHPPFGHNGERALQEKMAAFGGFEGNAQTLRIISRLEKKVQGLRPEGGWDDRLGLDLSYRAILTTLKYDKAIPLSGAKDKVAKGYYWDDKHLVDAAKVAVLGKVGEVPVKTIECSIMDIADDIAYSTYDLEDSFQAGFLTPIDLISSDDELLGTVAKEVRKSTGVDLNVGQILQVLTGLFNDIVDSEAVKNYDDDEAARDLVVAISAYKNSKNMAGSGHARTLFTAELVGEIVSAVKVEVNEEQPALSRAFLEEGALLKVETLKHFTYAAMISSTRVQVAEYRGKQIVSEIFDALAEERGVRLLPPDMRRLHGLAPTKADKMRVVCDFVAGMTDRYALEFYARLKSTSGETIFKPL